MNINVFIRTAAVLATYAVHNQVGLGL